jgi:hypothetical protein
MTALEDLNKINISSDEEAVALIIEHLITQKEVSNGPNGDCAYRGVTDEILDELYQYVVEPAQYNGKSCAVGCLIKDEFYDLNFEGFPVDNDLVKEALAYSHPEWKFNKRSERLLLILQKIHDTVPTTKWIYILDVFMQNYWQVAEIESSEHALEFLKAKTFDSYNFHIDEEVITNSLLVGINSLRLCNIHCVNNS